MAKITRFEDFICWQKAKSLVNCIYKLTREGPFSKDYPLRDQIRRAAISSMTNIGATEKVRIFDKNEQNANSLEIPA